MECINNKISNGSKTEQIEVLLSHKIGIKNRLDMKIKLKKTCASIKKVVFICLNLGSSSDESGILSLVLEKLM